MDLSNVSYSDLVKELERRKTNSARVSNSNMDIMQIIEPPTTVSHIATEAEKLKAKEEEIQALKEKAEELEFENECKSIKNKVIESMAQQEKEEAKLKAKIRDFEKRVYEQTHVSTVESQWSIAKLFGL